MASRAQVAAYVADKITSDRLGAVKAAAAWLAETGRKHEAGYLARDVALVLAESGYVFVRVTTARTLSESAWERVEAFVKQTTGAKELELEKVVDPGIIGGVRIETPGAALDATVRTKLTRFVEGVNNE